MIDFTRSQITHLSIHFVGNKGLGEELTTSDKCYEFKDDFTKETLMRYFTHPFKTDIYHRFKEQHDITLTTVVSVCEKIFSSSKNFVEASKSAASYLYDQSVHPKVKGGEFYVAYIKDVVVDGELTDAIGFFKTENKDTYLKVYQHVGEFELDYDNGININKLDKGCLVYNTEKESGYKMSIIDTTAKGSEIAMYWEEDFLQAKIKPNSYYHTKNFIETSRGFCEEVLTEENNVPKQDQMMMLNKSTGYFKEKDRFNVKDFEKEVLVQPELITAFRDYRDDYNKKLDLTAIDEFDVSPTAVKQNQKYMKSVVKLDKNFHIYIHGRHDYVERGYDEQMGLKYYKLYYLNEQ